MFALLKLISNYFSGDPKLPLISKVGNLSNIKKLFLHLLEIITFLVVSLPKLQKHALSNVILYPLYTYCSLSLFSTILVAPNKQFLNLKLLVGFLAKHLIHRQCKRLQFWLSNCFVLDLKDLYQIFFSFYIQKVLCYVKKQYIMD